MKKVNFGLLLVPLTLATLPLPAKAQEPTEESTMSYRYECAAGETFQAEFSPIGAIVQLSNETLTLAQIPSGSGARYSDGTTTLYTKGEEAFIEVNGETTYAECFGQSITEENTAESETTVESETTATTDETVEETVVEETTTEETVVEETAIDDSASSTDDSVTSETITSEGSSTSAGGLTTSEGSATSEQTTIQQTQTTQQTTVEPAPTSAQTTTPTSEPVRALW